MRPACRRSGVRAGRPRAAAWVLPLLAVALLVACSRQEAAWRSASDDDTVAAYDAYVDAYPAGAHAGQARQRLRALRERQDWQRALRLDAPESYQRYLADHPEGRFAAEARERLAAFLAARGGCCVVAPD